MKYPWWKQTPGELPLGDEPSADVEALRLKKEAELDDLRDHVQRTTIEFVEVRGRLRRETQREIERARLSVVVKFLEVLDNFDRALATGNSEDPFVQGVAQSCRMFLATLESLGVTRLDPTGQPFDPARHEAVALITAGQLASGHVVALVRPGYLVGADVIRPALVTVSA